MEKYSCTRMGLDCLERTQKTLNIKGKIDK
jgi:hypothetical protein